MGPGSRRNSRKAISPIIAIVIILLAVIAIAGAAYSAPQSTGPPRPARTSQLWAPAPQAMKRTSLSGIENSVYAKKL